MRDVVRELAKVDGCDIEIEDHGFMIISTIFHMEDSGMSKGFGYAIDTDFIRKFMEVFNADKLSEIDGKSCWVTHGGDRSHIHLIEPLHKADGKAFDVDAWLEEGERKYAKQK